MKTPNLHRIKTSGFKTPETYFESLDATILEKLKETSTLNTLKTSGFKIPETYFETLETKLLKKVQAPKVIPIWLSKKVIYVTAMAASLAILFGWFNKTANTTSFDTLETTSIETYLSEEAINTYDIASLLNDDDLVLDNFISETLPEDALENYLLNNTTIEELIIDNK